MTNDLGPGPRQEADKRETAEAQTTPPPAPDVVIVGGCRLHDLLGQGGQGTVYRATQLALGREVAVKVVPASGVAPELVSRFKREARTAAELEHPHTIPIHAAGEEDGLLYLVMRLVAGPDLGALIAAEGPLEPARAVALIGQVAGALDAAHAAGLVHRDIKPANILVERRAKGEHAYLSDFGLMRHAVGDTAITRVGEWVGSVDYVSPEQIEGRAVDARTDVYALTGVLFTALTGRPPFQRPTPAATALAHRHDPPPSLGAGTEAMSAVIAWGMAKSRDDRFASAGDLVRGASAALNVAPAAPGARAPARDQRRGAGLDGRPHPRGVGRRRRWLAALAGAAVLLAATVLTAILTGSSTSPVPPTTGASAAAPVSFPNAARFNGNGFAFSYPAGWQVVENQRSLGAFIRTKVVSPDGQQLLIVDRVPEDAMTPKARAISVSQSTARTPGYQLVSLAPLPLGTRNAFLWSFQLIGQPLPARFDIFQRLGTSGYAVLAEGPALSQVSHVALTVARALAGS
jgi:hypothetical protein